MKYLFIIFYVIFICHSNSQDHTKPLYVLYQENTRLLVKNQQEGIYSITNSEYIKKKKQEEILRSKGIIGPPILDDQCFDFFWYQRSFDVTNCIDTIHFTSVKDISEGKIILHPDMPVYFIEKINRVYHLNKTFLVPSE